MPRQYRRKEMTEKELDYVETIMDLLNQACYIEDKNDPTVSVVDHQCMSSYEHATALLEELGFAKETSLNSRTYYLFPKKIEEARHVLTTSASTPLQCGLTFQTTSPRCGYLGDDNKCGYGYRRYCPWRAEL
jgi:hypothetical protein